MALIFFDGFNRDFDTTHWAVTDETNMTLNGNVRTNSGPNSMYLYGGETLDYRLTLSNTGTHANKKLYFGFVLSNYAVDASDLVSYPRGRPFLRLYNNANTLVLTVAVDPTPATANSQVNYGNDVTFNIVQNSTIVDSYTFGIAATNGSTKIIPNGSWRYFEFEIDLASPTNTIAMHFEGVPIQNSNASPTTNLTTIADISKIEFVAGRVYQQVWWQPATGTFIDDFYLVDDTGSRENTWLGPETVVRNISVNSDNFDSAVDTNQWYSTGDGSRLYSDDGDISGIRSNAFNQYQIYNWSNIDANGLTPGTLIGALRISTKAKNASLPAAYRLVGKSAVNTLYDLSDKYVLNNNMYTTYGPEYILNNPATTDRWTVADINAFRFGVKSEDPAP